MTAPVWVGNAATTVAAGGATINGNAANALAYGSTALPASAHHRFTAVIATGDESMMGLKTVASIPTSHTDINFALYFSAGTLYSYESGSFTGHNHAGVVVGDTITVDVNAGVVTYELNGTVFWTSAVTASGNLYTAYAADLGKTNGYTGCDIPTFTVPADVGSVSIYANVSDVAPVVPVADRPAGAVSYNVESFKGGVSQGTVSVVAPVAEYLALANGSWVFKFKAVNQYGIASANWVASASVSLPFGAVSVTITRDKATLNPGEGSTESWAASSYTGLTLTIDGDVKVADGSAVTVTANESKADKFAHALARTLLTSYGGNMTDAEKAELGSIL